MDSLNDLIQATHQQVIEAQQLSEAQHQAERDQRANEAIKQFRQDLTFALGADLMGALPLRDWRVQWSSPNGSPDPDSGGKVRAHFTDLESGQWVIESNFGKQTSLFGREEPTRRYRFECFKVWWNHYPQYHNQNVGGSELREKLLFNIGEARLETAKHLDEKERVEAERQRQAEMNRVHEEIVALIETRRAEALAEMWRWAEGKSITYYGVRWVSGAAVALDQYENSYCEIEHDSGFTLADKLDGDGWIELMRPNGDPRRIKLSMEAHKPVWEMFTASCMDDLPHQLVTHHDTTIEGIINEYADDDIRRWRYAEGETATIQVAQNALPVRWVRDLVDAG